MTIETELVELNNTKAAIATAIESHGRNLAGKTFSEYAPEIELIEGGGDCCNPDTLTGLEATWTPIALAVNGILVANKQDNYDRVDTEQPGVVVNFTGVEYLSVTELVGTETVVSSVGTSTPTVSVGRIDFSSGYISYLELSNGSIYVAANLEYDISDNKHHATPSEPLIVTAHEMGDQSMNTNGYSVVETLSIVDQFNSVSNWQSSIYTAQQLEAVEITAGNGSVSQTIKVAQTFSHSDVRLKVNITNFSGGLGVRPDVIVDGVLTRLSTLKTAGPEMPAEYFQSGGEYIFDISGTLTEIRFYRHSTHDGAGYYSVEIEKNTESIIPSKIDGSAAADGSVLQYSGLNSYGLEIVSGTSFADYVVKYPEFGRLAQYLAGTGLEGGTSVSLAAITTSENVVVLNDSSISTWSESPSLADILSEIL